VGLVTDIFGHLSFSSDIFLFRPLSLPTVISSVREQSPAKSMLRDNREDEWGARLPARNVLGEPLELCSIKPMTGFYRDGCCNTGREDVGSHTICVVMTDAFLAFSKSRGNDLSTPIPEIGFAGLKAGDRWCLCAQRWQESFEAAHAPRVVLRATHEAALTYCSLGDLKRFAIDLA
jgi:hypothetical protein